MTTLLSASYALRRQKLAVERTMYASSAEESQLAARWANAWHRLVQRKLDQAEPARKTGMSAIGPLNALHGLGSVNNLNGLNGGVYGNQRPARVLH